MINQKERLKAMTNKMTDGEKMVWAAAFAVEANKNDRVDIANAQSCVASGDFAVDMLRTAARSGDRDAKELTADSAQSDVEAALVEALAKCERGEMFFKEPCTAAGRFRDEVESRIGRPLRGAK